MVVVVSHLFLFLGDKFRGRCDSHESHLPLCGTIYFPTAPFHFLLRRKLKGLFLMFGDLVFILSVVLYFFK